MTHLSGAFSRVGDEMDLMAFAGPHSGQGDDEVAVSER